MTPDEFRAARAKLGLTLSELAERIGKDRQTIHRYESGELAVPLVVALAIEHLSCRKRRKRA